MIPELFKIGPLTVGSFGVMAMLAFLIPTLLIRKELSRIGRDPDIANGIAVAAMIGGFIGARIYFIAERWDVFYADPANRFGVHMLLLALIPTFILWQVLAKKGHDAIRRANITLAALIGVLLLSVVGYIAFLDERTWEQYVAISNRANLLFTGAGLVWYGGLIGGFAFVSYYVHHKGLGIPRVCDLMAPMLALGQAFGRMGCLLSGDGDYGPPADVPWAMSFPDGIVPTTQEVHPTPIYDMIILVSIFVFLWNIRKKEMPTGYKFSLYLILMSLGRIFTEFYRTTPDVLFGLTMAQVISVALISIGVTWILIAKAPQQRKPDTAKKQEVKAS